MQVRTEQAVQIFAQEEVYVPLPTQSVSELIMTATEMNNFTKAIQCVVEPNDKTLQAESSDSVYLLVYGE